MKKLKNKGFIWWICLLLLFSIPIARERFYSKDDLQYITVENAEVKYHAGNRYESTCAIINDIYYLPLSGYRNKSQEEYDKIASVIKSEKITIGVVENLQFQIRQLDPDCKLVVTLAAESSQPYTLESYNNGTKKSLIIDIVFIAFYLFLSLVYVIIIYLLGERKLRRKWRRWKKKRKLQKKFGKNE